jgi:hypothetical protein
MRTCCPEDVRPLFASFPHSLNSRGMRFGTTCAAVNDQTSRVRSSRKLAAHFYSEGARGANDTLQRQTQLTNWMGLPYIRCRYSVWRGR